MQRLKTENNAIAYGVNMKITKNKRNLLLYMALGDGYIHKAGYMSIRHCMAQEDYLDWKIRLLKTEGLSLSDKYYHKNNGYGSYEFRTKTYKFLKLYRKVLYSGSGKSIFSNKILNKLTPLGIAIWYMDGGGLSQKKRDGMVVANELMINTHLSKDENQVIIDYFKVKWGIQFSQVKNRGKYRLRCGTKEARKFISIVKPYVSQVKSMEHKLKIKK